MNLQTDNNSVSLFGKVNFRNRETPFGIKMDDRRRHMYIIGKTGMGKSELLKTIAIQDIQDGRGLAFIDPHGDPVDDLLDYIPENRINDVIYFNPADLEFPISFNVMEQVDFDKRHLVADGLLAVFKKIWVDAWSARMEYILNYTILALLEMPGATLLGINRMLAEKDYRREVIEHITDSEVKAFWTKEFAGYTERYTAEAVPAIQNKIGQFVSNRLVRNIVGQTKSSFDMRQAMDEGKILMVDVSKGRVGEDASRLLGALLVTKIQLAAMSRIDISKNERRDFVLVVDEFQNFATASFANILSEARKFNLSLVVAHQYVAQMEEEVADAVFGNVGTIVAFRVGAEDAEMLEKEFTPEFTAEDIVNLGKRQIYLKLMIDGVASRAFSAMTIDTPPVLERSWRQEIINASRARYARPRAEVEELITQWRGVNGPTGGGFGPARPLAPVAPRPQMDNQSNNPPLRPHRRRNRGPSHSGGGFGAPPNSPPPQEVALSQAFSSNPVQFKTPKPPLARLSRATRENQKSSPDGRDELRRAIQEALGKKSDS